MDMALKSEDNNGASDQVFNEVLGEIGVQIAGDLEQGNVQKLVRPQQANNPNMNELECRFNAVK